MSGDRPAPDRIASIEAFHLSIPASYGGPPPRQPAQWPFVQQLLIRVETGLGHVGWGEAFGHNACAASKVALETLVAPLCIGQDATDIDATLSALRRALHVYGLGGPVGFALSGLDIALWDIRGQAAGKPLRNLLAPDPGSCVAAYASLLRYGDAELAGAAAADAMARGHAAVKLHEATVASVASARAAIGSAVPLMLDVNCRWSPEEAADHLWEMRHLDLAWVEDPCWPPEASQLAWLAARTGMAMAAGENAASLDELTELASVGKVAHLQPSAAKIGGVSGLLAAREIALRHGCGVATHSAYFGPALAATAQFCAAYGLDCEWYDCRLEASPIGFRPVRGRLELSGLPGLGIEVDMAVVDAYRAA